MELYKNPELRAEMWKDNIEDSRKYSVDIAVKKMAEIYGEVVSENVGECVKKM